MDAYLIAALVVIAAFLVFRGWSWLVRAQLDRADHHAKWVNRYSEKMRAILAREDLPEHLLKSLGRWNALITLHDAPALVAKGLRARKSTPDEARRIDEMARDRAALPQDLKDLFYDVVVHALMVVSYKSLFLGWVIRAQMAEEFVERKPVRADRLIEVVRKRTGGSLLNGEPQPA